MSAARGFREGDVHPEYGAAKRVFCKREPWRDMLAVFLLFFGICGLGGLVAAFAPPPANQPAPARDPTLAVWTMIGIGVLVGSLFALMIYLATVREVVVFERGLHYRTWRGAFVPRDCVLGVAPGRNEPREVGVLIRKSRWKRCLLLQGSLAAALRELRREYGEWRSEPEAARAALEHFDSDRPDRWEIDRGHRGHRERVLWAIGGAMGIVAIVVWQDSIWMLLTDVELPRWATFTALFVIVHVGAFALWLLWEALALFWRRPARAIVANSSGIVIERHRGAATTFPRERIVGVEMERLRGRLPYVRVAIQSEHGVEQWLFPLRRLRKETATTVRPRLAARFGSLEEPMGRRGARLTARRSSGEK